MVQTAMGPLKSNCRISSNITKYYFIKTKQKTGRDWSVANGIKGAWNGAKAVGSGAYHGAKAVGSGVYRAGSAVANTSLGDVANAGSRLGSAISRKSKAAYNALEMERVQKESALLEMRKKKCIIFL